MDGINLPEFLNTEEKYNKLIRDVDTIKKFEDIFLKLLDDDTLEISSILTLMKVIERDVILVNKLTEATALIEMTESFIRYIMMKESGSPKKEDVEPKKPKMLKKIASKKVKKLSKEEKKLKPADEQEVKEGIWTCDCPYPD